ncbi:hypothetical protein PFY12_13830 [Chryseobacterium camelliae]|uniref:Uncharacterized protein n=1 Tax=Chryseobacterium camelliae TaxID=1265445 RepID=A0ABY7QKE5_9FLAO|nr:hypothetical protein [Chryseobacterium camelliae]WBV60110.1 hypothetical protein PFY12_13830 [Chryseobacterium camelliae]
MSTSIIKKFSPLMIGFVIAGTLIILFFDVVFTSRSKFDVVDKPNDKMIVMFNTEIDKEIDAHTHSIDHKGYIPESRQSTINYLNTLKSIEGYARYGVKSMKARNYIELKIEFTDGKIVDQVYTGQNVSGFMAPSLLMKVIMRKGKAIKVYTNGQERKASPEWAIPDINLMIDKAISYDIIQHRDSYFAPYKKQQDIDKEWKEQ